MAEKLSPIISSDTDGFLRHLQIGESNGEETVINIVNLVPGGQRILCASKSPKFCPNCEANEQYKVVCKLKLQGKV